MMHRIFTIGHSNLTYLKFLSLVQNHHINHIIDVRSVPYSRHAPWSNKSRLPELMKPAAIRYTYLGHQLGGKNKTPEQITSPPVYQETIDVLLNLANRDILCLLCAEADPAKCHRQHIIAQSLIQANTEVIHILTNGAEKPAWREEPDISQPKLF